MLHLSSLRGPKARGNPFGGLGCFGDWLGFVWIAASRSPSNDDFEGIGGLWWGGWVTNSPPLEGWFTIPLQMRGIYRAIALTLAGASEERGAALAETLPAGE
jgi:hypothetical protein